MFRDIYLNIPPKLAPISIQDRIKSQNKEKL